MQWLRFAVLLLLLALLQSNLVDVFAVAGHKPDLLLILLVFLGIFYPEQDVIIGSFAIGFVYDLISPAMGPGTLAFLLLGSTLGYLSNLFSLRRMPFQAFAIFITGVGAAWSMHMLSKLASSQAVYQDAIGFFISTPAYSAVIGPFLFLPIAWWMRIKINQRRRSRN